MKLHRLELAGFGPFLERQTVDFDAFASDGIFLISGRTGAGKSSVLDGVSFALYGSVPRYDGTEKRLRSDHALPQDVTEVSLEFSVGDRRLRVTRSPEYERPKKNGTGVTTEPTHALLEEWQGGTWQGLAAMPRDVGLLLPDIVGLSAAQFQQVILLAQNKFSRFLLAPVPERQELLRTLFGTRRYKDYAERLDEQAKAARASRDRLSERVRTLLDEADRTIAGSGLLPEPSAVAEGDESAASEAPQATVDPHDVAGRIAAAEGALQRAQYRQEVAENVARDTAETFAKADASHALAVILAKAQRDLAATEERIAELRRDAATMDEHRARLELAARAEPVRELLDSAVRADRAVTAAEALALTTREGWITVAGEHADASGSALDDLVEALTGDLARLADAQDSETQWGAAQEQLAKARTHVTTCEKRVADAERARALFPQQRASLAERRDAAGAHAALAPSAAAEREASAETLRAARERDTLASAARDADTAYADAARRSATAATHVAALVQRRLGGFAAELASTLIDGEKCPVCGAAEHPHPAPPTAEPVGQSDLDAAEAGRTAALDRERTARDVAHGVREKLAAATARAGDATIDSLQQRHSDALAASDVAEAAQAEREALSAEHAALEQAEAEHESTRTALVAALASARESVAAHEQSESALRALLQDARGSFATIADRTVHVAAVRDAARGFRDASVAAGRAADAQQAAISAVTDALTLTGFATRDDAAAAALTPAETASLTQTLARYDTEYRTANETALALGLDIASAPAGTPSVDVSAALRQSADEARADAIRSAEKARGLSAALRGLLVQIDDAYADVAARADDALAVTRLADTVAGRAPNALKMNLETFVLAAELEEIVAAANIRLAEMSSGRFSLHHSAALVRGASGLGIEVLDAHTGLRRPPQSLSGGETFLASLALALGLAEVVTSRAGGVRLDTLFIDEGFGSLDADTLELAMRTLDELRAGGRTVGIISHVEAMKEQLPAQLTVEATPSGPSIIRQR